MFAGRQRDELAFKAMEHPCSDRDFETGDRVRWAKYGKGGRQREIDSNRKLGQGLRSGDI